MLPHYAEIAIGPHHNAASEAQEVRLAKELSQVLPSSVQQDVHRLWLTSRQAYALAHLLRRHSKPALILALEEEAPKVAALEEYGG